MVTSRRSLRPIKLTTLRLGIVFVTLALVAGVALFQKQAILTTIRPGTTITAEFSAAHRLREYVSEAKIAGVRIGVVKSVHRGKNGLTEVELKVDEDALKSMGSSPSAAIRPATLLGGNYYVEILPGGRRGTFHGTIPLSRTKLPVELDAVAAALPADARKGIRSSVTDLNSTLDKDGASALRDLVSSAPDTLDPMATALAALQGTRPKSDLRKLVGGLESTSRVLSAKQGQLDDIVADLSRTSSILADRSRDMATATARMPSTLTDAQEMLPKLSSTLDTLKATAGAARPSVRELRQVLTSLDPVVEQAVPVVSDLRAVLKDGRPLVSDLLPISSDLTASFGNIRGPVLDRVNGPIMATVLSPWHGTGPYAGGGADRPLYKEVAYMASNLTQANMVDQNGAMVSFFPGVGPGSLSGLQISLEQLFSQLANSKGAAR